MIVHHMAGGPYGWILSVHQNAASLFSSLISLCGLFAIYFLLCLLNATTITPGEIAATSQRDVVTEYLLNHQDAPPEEISFCAFILATLPKPNSQRTKEQVGAFINLLISFGLGLMILVILSAATLICYPRRADSEEESLEERRASRGFRLLKVGLMLRRYHIKLQFEDACEKADADAPTVWMIPKPGSPNDAEAGHPRRRVVDRCAICLEQYVAGDKVAYSSNRNCEHVFHEQCCSSWILSSASTNQRCPCCRQTFLSLQDLSEIAKKTSH